MRVLYALCGIPLFLLAIGCRNAMNDRMGAAPNNTEINERDADGSTATSFDQSNDQADIDLVAKIRNEIVNLDDISVSGRNIKIVTNYGKVILRGPVATMAEKEKIEQIALSAAGEGNVTNELEVNRNGLLTDH